MTKERRSILVIATASAIAVAANLYRINLILGWVALVTAIIGSVIVWRKYAD